MSRQPTNATVEVVTISGRRLHRLDLNGTVRTGPAPQILILLREAAMLERNRIQQLRHDESDAWASLKARVARSDSSAEARTDLTHVRAEIAEATERAGHLESLSVNVRAAAVEDYAELLRQQHEAAIARVTATLPPVPLIGEIS